MNDFVDTDAEEEALARRSAITRHWEAVAAGNWDRVGHLFAPNALLDLPQSGERFTGADTIRGHLAAEGSPKGLRMRSVLGQQDLWITDFEAEVKGQRQIVVSVMEFQDGQVCRETRYFAPLAPRPAV